jgi:hypothetical protein
MSGQRVRVIAGVVAVVAVLVSSGCSKSEAKPDSARPDSGRPTTTSASTAATASSAADSADVVQQADLLEVTLPVPKNVPASGKWIDTPPPSSDGGDRLANFVNGDDYWMSVRFVDCNIPAVKRAAGKAATERGDFSSCFDTPTAKLGNYPMFTPNDVRRVVRVGRLIIIAGIGATGETTLKAADLEAFLKSLDLAGIAKL